MYDEIQKIIAPNMLSSFEYTKLEELNKLYTEEEIINVYRKVGYKPIEYIKKAITKKQHVVPEWLNREIINEPLTKEDLKEDEEFQQFIKEFREGKYD